MVIDPVGAVAALPVLDVMSIEWPDEDTPCSWPHDGGCESPRGVVARVRVRGNPVRLRTASQDQRRNGRGVDSHALSAVRRSDPGPGPVATAPVTGRFF